MHVQRKLTIAYIMNATRSKHGQGMQPTAARAVAECGKSHHKTNKRASCALHETSRGRSFGGPPIFYR